MPNTTHDRKIVASSQYHESRTICNRYGIGIRELRSLLLDIGQNGKSEHSRKEIYAKLEKRGYRADGITVIHNTEDGEWIATDGKLTVTGATEKEAIERLKND
jgi:hypothetical protein